MRRRAFPALAALAALGMLAFPSPLRAQDMSPALLSTANCEPVPGPGAPPTNAPRIVGAEGVEHLTLFGPRATVVVTGGTADGLSVGQPFFIRRAMDWGTRKSTGIHAVETTGGLHITAVNDTTALAVVDFACDGIMATDFLVPYEPPAFSEDFNRTDASGEPDFAAAGHLLFGDNDRSTLGTGEFMVADLGTSRGVAPGSRFAVYRDTRANGMPIQSIGEAVAVSADANTSVVRFTLTRDAIRSGDLLVPRRTR